MLNFNGVYYRLLEPYSPLESGQQTFDVYQSYKFYHFFSVCFGLGCTLALYRPYRSLLIPSVISVFFTLMFEFVGVMCGLPAHTKRCKGPPYDRRDAYWGLCAALLVAVINLNSYHVYTLSYGCGIMVFAVRGAKRKYNSLWEMRERLGRGW